MELFLAALSLLLLRHGVRGASNLKDNSPNCTCYYVNTTEGPSYFQYYRFYDFRHLAEHSGQYVNTPPSVGADQDSGSEMTPDQAVLNSSSWNQDWDIQEWKKKSTREFPLKMVNSPQNVFIRQKDSPDINQTDYDTFLTLRTTRQKDFQSSAEIENLQKNLMHASLRVKARVQGSEGACAGFFTYYDEANESDIEILTRDPNTTYRYTNQPAVNNAGNEVPESSKRINNLPAWSDWQVHRIDWLHNISLWYLNNTLVVNNTYSVPRTPSGLIVNMWSDGGEWSGKMKVGNEAELQIQWIELVFNTSGPRLGPDGGVNRKRSLAARGIIEDPSEYVRGVGEGEFAATRHVQPYSLRSPHSRLWPHSWNPWQKWSAGSDVDSLSGSERYLNRRDDDDDDDSDTRYCKVVCNVDNVKDVGYPEIAHVSGAWSWCQFGKKKVWTLYLCWLLYWVFGDDVVGAFGQHPL